MVVIAAMAVMLIGATAFATDSVFAGGHGHKKSYEKNQALSQANACGNGKLPYNVKRWSRIGRSMYDDATVLRDYNHGYLTPGCGP